MKTKTIKTYSFGELSDSAKNRARDWYRSGAFEDSFWSESTMDEAQEQGELLGINFRMRGNRQTEPCIYWSGFSSQGDGACFEGTWYASEVKASKVADGWGDDPATTEIKRIASELASVAERFPNARASVTHRDRYCHEHSVSFDIELSDESEDLSDEAQDSAREQITEALRDFMRWIYRQLEKEFEYVNSDEAVDESIIANDYDFTEDGERSCIL